MDCLVQIGGTGVLPVSEGSGYLVYVVFSTWTTRREILRRKGVQGGHRKGVNVIRFH